MIYDNIGELIGRTPMVRLHFDDPAVKAEIVAKVELFNPGGSIKDRVGAYMLQDAEAKGKIAPGATIIEPTSGNTGIGLAAIGASKGYKVIIVMPDTMSVERQQLLKAYGAEIVLTEGAKGMLGSIEKANELKKSTPKGI